MTTLLSKSLSLSHSERHTNIPEWCVSSHTEVFCPPFNLNVLTQGSVISAIGGAINAIVSAIANVIETIVSAIASVCPFCMLFNFFILT